MSLVVRSQRFSLKDKVREMLPLLFSIGISEGFIEVMHDIIKAIPELKTDVFDGLMDQLYQLLMVNYIIICNSTLIIGQPKNRTGLVLVN
jgi:hypothetical protein